MEFTFDEWMKAIDSILFDKFGIESEELTDQPYFDLYENEYTPNEAISILFEEHYSEFIDLLEDLE